MRALVLVAVAAVVVLALQARSGETAAAVPDELVVEPTLAELASVKPGPLPRAKVALEARLSVGAAVVGDRRLWPALDSVRNTEYLKYFTLRAVGQHIEVWVASDQDAVSKNLSFPPVTAATTIGSSSATRRRSTSPSSSTP